MAKKKKISDIKTRCIHTGEDTDKQYNSVITPVYQTSIFRFRGPGQPGAYDYTRSGNPTRTALEENIAQLEGGVACSVTASGMAAVMTVMFLLKTGDHVVAGQDIYGGTYRFFKGVMSRMGITFSFTALDDPLRAAAAFRPETRLLWIETPSNPLLKVLDLEGLMALAKAKRTLSVVDNTILSPYFQRPFDFGADIVVHSTTKYLNGHSDVVGGAVVYGHRDLAARGRGLVSTLGIAQSPFDAWLVLRGIKTLPQRMEAHQRGAAAIAEFLQDHRCVKKVYYPGLPFHFQQKLIKKQMTGYGGVLSFDIDSRKVHLGRFFKRLRYFSLAGSLGGIESLIEQPWTMSHASMDRAALEAAGISRETIRISAGIESPVDLIEDLKQALRER